MNKNAKPMVVVAMSGGVDSSVAAAMLVEQGYQVVGMMLRLWSEPGTENDNQCCTPDAMNQARRVAAQLGIPFYAVDARDPFYLKVVQSFVQGYQAGITPNPCLVCNRSIRWGVLLEHARALGAEFMATGHYAIVEPLANGQIHLKKGRDERKDQSYVLSGLSQDQLRHSLFPLGNYLKPEVRELARSFGLTVAERKESQDLCFLGREDYRTFLKRYAPDVSKPGNIIDQNGNVMGEHDGLAFYTIGQRKGIRIAAEKPLYVLGKDKDKNAIIVGGLEELGSDELWAEEVNWTCGEKPEQPFRAMVKIRYKAQPAWGMVNPHADGRFFVKFDEVLRDITPGQMAVIYRGDLVVGGGIIKDNKLT